MSTETEETSTNQADEYSAAVMKLYAIGEQMSIQNYSTMKNAQHLVNTFGGDFSSEMKANLAIYTYKILKSMMRPPLPLPLYTMDERKIKKWFSSFLPHFVHRLRQTAN
jgi:hypothetical protein